MAACLLGVFPLHRRRIDAGGRQLDCQRLKLRRARGNRRLATHPRFVKNNDRVVHGKEIMAHPSPCPVRRSPWRGLARRTGKGPACPRGRSTISPQVLHRSGTRSPRGMQIKVDHPFEHALSLTENRSPFRGTPCEGIPRPAAAPALTPKRCWRESGYDEEKAEAVKAAEDRRAATERRARYSAAISVSHSATSAGSRRGLRSRR